MKRPTYSLSRGTPCHRCGRNYQQALTRTIPLKGTRGPSTILTHLEWPTVRDTTRREPEPAGIMTTIRQRRLDISNYQAITRRPMNRGQPLDSLPLRRSTLVMKDRNETPGVAAAVHGLSSRTCFSTRRSPYGAPVCRRP
jgi:hypothetical protein